MTTRSRTTRSGAATAAALVLFASGVSAQEGPPTEAAPTRYERVSLRELGATPKRFHNRPLEIARVKCLRGGPDEYRCVPASDGDLTFILRAIEPAASRAIIDRDCTSLAETLRRSSCTVTLRIVPRTELNMSVRGMTRTIIGAPVGHVAPAR